MATKYSVRWCFEGKDSESIALLADTVPREVIVDFVDSLWANVADWDDNDRTLRWVDCIDMDTGEVIHDCDSWDESDPDWPDMSKYDDDMGFDPYLGCYTDDC